MIKRYVKYRKSYFFLFLSVVIFFPFIHFLYRFPMESIIYSCIIFTFFFLVWLFIDGYYYRSKIHRLDLLIDELTGNNQDMPLAENMIEEKYQIMIETLYQLLKDNTLGMENAHSEQMEYYTMWVHQIKTPISAMRLALQSREIADTNIIDQELFKIEQYVEMALQYIKIGQLSSDLVIREYSLKDIVYASVKKYATLFIYKKLSIDIGDCCVKVLTDSKWLSFILEQLLSNAVKYTNLGGVRIYLKEDALVIEDTGIGIRAEDMERIFEKGYTGYNGRLDKKASGIGLYLVKKVADSLSLKVSVSSETGVGTIVVLTFPKRDMFLE